MRVGVIGRGPWGDVYAKTLREMGVDFWQAGRDWPTHPLPDAAIVACAANAHFFVAKRLIALGVPLLIEKPVCLNLRDTEQLLRYAKLKRAVVFTGHTRLYSARWIAFRADALKTGVKSVYGIAGGKCKLPYLWDWGPHLVAMCIDLGFDPLKAYLLLDSHEQPLKVIVNGEETYVDAPEIPQPLENLLSEFLFAAATGEANFTGLELGVQVVRALEAIERRHRVLGINIAEVEYPDEAEHGA